MADIKTNRIGYGLTNPLQDLATLPIISLRAPTTGDIRYPIGQMWVYKTTGQAYMLANVAANSATWSLLGPGSSDVDTLTGDSGGAISPLAGTITLAGGTNITTAGAGNTITANLDAAITLATSVTSPIYTAAAGLAINTVAGNDITVKLGDAAAANKISFVDSASAEVAKIDSNGGITGVAGTLTTLGVTTITATTVNGTTFDTNVAAAGVTLAGTTLAADGTDADISLTLTPKGTGNVTVTTGDVSVTDGNVAIVGAGKQLQVESGAVTDSIGTATLVLGTVTIANTNINANDKIFLSRQGAAASTTLGELSYTISAATSFTITSLQTGTPGSTETGDVSLVDYLIVRAL